MTKQALYFPLQVIWEVEICKLSGCSFWFFVARIACVIESNYQSHLIGLYYWANEKSMAMPLAPSSVDKLRFVIFFAALLPWLFLSSLPGEKTCAKLPLRKDLPVYRVWQSLLSSWQTATPHAPTFRPQRFPVFYVWEAI